MLWEFPLCLFVPHFLIVSVGLTLPLKCLENWLIFLLHSFIRGWNHARSRIFCSHICHMIKWTVCYMVIGKGKFLKIWNFDRSSLKRSLLSSGLNRGQKKRAFLWLLVKISKFALIFFVLHLWRTINEYWIILFYEAN